MQRGACRKNAESAQLPPPLPPSPHTLQVQESNSLCQFIFIIKQVSKGGLEGSILHDGRLALSLQLVHLQSDLLLQTEEGLWDGLLEQSLRV